MDLTTEKPRLVLKTADAAYAMKMSQGHLKRQMDSKGGPLIAGEDYFLGAHKTSPIRWDVESCREKFHQLGMLSRKEQA